MTAADTQSGSRATRGARTASVVPSFLVGLLLGVSYLKWGNPVILDSLVVAPTTPLEWLIMAWPVAWGYACLAGVVAVVVYSMARQDRGPWRDAMVGGWPRQALLMLPLAWFGWQCVASLGSVDPALSRAVLPQFACCIACFYAGWLGLRGAPNVRAFWIPVLLGFALTLLNGFEQHYGGLERTREMIRSQPGWERLPPELLRRFESNRVFSTLFYANTLAGLVLLVLPAAARHLWTIGARWPQVIRASAVGSLAYAGLACLYWSGSKAGWLVAGAMLVVLCWRILPKGKLRWSVMGTVIALGLTVFSLRFAAYFDKGATSAVARFDCWHAALQIARTYPVTGSGPGTFGVLYKTLKKPSAEMAKLVHNDYLEQVSDSGWVGGVLFLGLMGLSICRAQQRPDPTTPGFLLWLGVVGWALHSFVEFGLYIPAISWTAFVFLGLLAARPVAEAAGLGAGAGDGKGPGVAAAGYRR